MRTYGLSLRHNRGKRKTGFTLVELLVVISIIALLMAMLLPAVTRARALAQQVACQSSMRQIGAAVIAYSSSHNGLIPPTWLGPNYNVVFNGSERTGWVSWKWLLVAYGNLQGDGTDSALGGSQGVWVCPAMPTASQEYKPKSKIGQDVSGPKGGRVWGDVNAHRAMNREVMGRYNGRVKLSSFNRPSNTILLLETTWHGSNVPVDWVPLTPPGDPGGPIVHWHNSGAKPGANYVMPDGHVTFSIASDMVGPHCRWHDNPQEGIKPHPSIVTDLKGDSTLQE